MKILGVNGINTHGDQNIDLLLSDLEKAGHRAVDVRLPWRHILTARFGGKSDGREIARHSDDGDILVCHSFGGVRAWHAHHLVDYSAIFCIAPAMSRDVEWRNPSRVWCFYSPKDWVVWLGSFLLFHPFGPAGVKGFSHPEVHNRRMASDHDDYFSNPVLRRHIFEHVDLYARRLYENAGRDHGLHN